MNNKEYMFIPDKSGKVNTIEYHTAMFTSSNTHNKGKDNEKVYHVAKFTVPPAIINYLGYDVIDENTNKCNSIKLYFTPKKSKKVNDLYVEYDLTESSKSDKSISGTIVYNGKYVKDPATNKNVAIQNANYKIAIPKQIIPESEYDKDIVIVLEFKVNGKNKFNNGNVGSLSLRIEGL